MSGMALAKAAGALDRAPDLGKPVTNRQTVVFKLTQVQTPQLNGQSCWTVV